MAKAETVPSVDEETKKKKSVAQITKGLNTLMAKSFGGFEAVTMSDISSRDVEMIPSDFLDLNRIMTGSLFKFSPPGNVITLAGKEASGKSLIALNLLKNAQSRGYFPVLVETEQAVHKRTLSNAGISLIGDNGLVLRLGYVEQCLVALDRLITDCIDSGIKPFIVLDSLGNLDLEKTVKDVAKGEIKMDMGLLQKTIKIFLKHICNRCGHNGIPFLIVTHIFFDPSPYGGGVKIFGGQHLKFLSNTTLFTSSAKKKDKTGFDLKGLTLKNRMAPPLQECSIEIDIRTSQANRFAGIAELALSLGVFEPGKQSRMYLPHLDKQFHVSDIYKMGSQIFTQELLEVIDDKLSTTGYSSITFTDGDVGDIMTNLEGQVRSKEKPTADAEYDPKSLFSLEDPEETKDPDREEPLIQ